jgi:hypothetical protein
MTLPDLRRLSRPLARVLRVPEDRLDASLMSATEADVPALERLRREVFGAEVDWDDRAYLRWRYRLDGGPLRSAEEIAPGTSRLWLFKRADEILGTLGTERLTLATPDGDLDALRFMDLASAPPVRGVGIGAWLNLKLIPQMPAGISIGGSDEAVAMIGRLFHRMPDRRVFALPLRVGPLVAARWPRAARLPMVDLAGKIAERALALRRRIASAEPVELVELPRPDETVDALCRSMVRAGFTLAARSAAQWRWRYLENPRRRYTLHAARRRGETVALLVSRRRGELGEIVDWLWSGEPGDVLPAAFASLMDTFAREGASKVRAMTYDALSSAVCRRLGMRERLQPTTYALRARPAALETRLVTARWFVTYGDSDGD